MPLPRACIALLAFLLLPALPARGGEETSLGTPAARLVEAQADTVVSIRFLLKTRLSMMGQSQEQEASREVRGVLVDESGLVMTANSHFEGGMTGGIIRLLGDQLDLDTAPSDFKVLFGTEEEEHEARLVARDSDLGLAFLQIRDLKGRTPRPLDLAEAVEPQVGSDLLALSRMVRAFDCAPSVTRLYVTARVERPRPMWAVSGDPRAPAGMPVFSRGGQPVGVLTSQQGAEGVVASDESGPDLMGLAEAAESLAFFVVPAEALRPVIRAARERAASMRAEEEAEGAAEEGSAEGE